MMHRACRAMHTGAISSTALAALLAVMQRRSSALLLLLLCCSCALVFEAVLHEQSVFPRFSHQRPALKRPLAPPIGFSVFLSFFSPVKKKRDRM